MTLIRCLRKCGVPTRATFVVSGFIGLAAVAGCGWSIRATSDHNPEVAKETLTAALKAWKLDNTQSLAKRNPSIRFVDDDQSAGLKLTDFELDQTNQFVPYRNVKVTLVLRDKRGQILRKTATYQVALDPNPSVLRSDN